MVIAVILHDPGGVAQDGGHFGGKGVIRAEGAGQLKLALILVGDGDRGPGEELDELEQNKRERVAAEDHHMRIDRDAAILEAVVEAVADGVGKNTVLERHAGAQLLDLAHVQHNVLCQNGDTGCVAAMRLQPGFAIAACAAEIPCVAADGVANAEARVIGQFAQIFDLTGKFMPDDRFWQRPGEVVALVERDIVVTDADIADPA